ncbi:MAG: hypothetical protein EXS05_14510 [Planctomycetaceae bacterium]|nr:hypothetical protein [Planctomycetaceae bacterium]
MPPRKRMRPWELPLLVKELNEQSSRPRTYVIRFLYAATLFGAACSLFYGSFGSDGDDGTVVLGRGRFMFERLVTFQFYSIFLFLPAISCSALTIEKERNSLGLLLITALRPWQIALQKTLGRVVPMVTYVLLSFPLMAVAYSFGGVTEDYLWSGTYLLVLTGLQVGALSIACSAYFPTTVEAFIAHYVIFLVLYGILPIGWGPFLFSKADEVPFVSTLFSSFLMVMLTGGFLVAGWMFVESRAFVPPKNVLLGLFKRLDAWFNDMNQVTGGVVLVRDGDPLPQSRPVAWRETAKKSLGTFRYLFRVLVALELPLLFICQMVRLAGPGGGNLQSISVFLYVLWLLSTAMIVVHAGSVISSERSRQTLDVLLTTPLSGREIVQQKLQGVWRLIGVLLVPFLTIFGFETWWNTFGTYRWAYLPLAIAAMLVYLPLIAWVALAVGLRVKSQMKGVLTAMSLIGAWLLAPIVVRFVLIGRLGFDDRSVVAQLLMLFPSELIPAIERTGSVVIITGSTSLQPAMPPFLIFILNLLLHTTALYYLRRWCLAHADRMLGRLSDEPQSQPQHLEPEALAAPIGQMAT